MQEEFFMNSMEKDPKLNGEHGAQTSILRSGCRMRMQQ